MNKYKVFIFSLWVVFVVIVRYVIVACMKYQEGHYERDVANKSASRPHSRKRRATFGIGDSNDFKREQDNNMAGKHKVYNVILIHTCNYLYRLKKRMLML